MARQIIITLCLLMSNSVLAFVPTSRPIAFAATNVIAITQQAKLPTKLFSDNSDGPTEDEKIEAALEEFKQQSQVKAIAVLIAAFSAFVYLKLQYDADPSSFVGGH